MRQGGGGGAGWPGARPGRATVCAICVPRLRMHCASAPFVTPQRAPTGHNGPQRGEARGRGDLHAGGGHESHRPALPCPTPLLAGTASTRR